MRYRILHPTDSSGSWYALYDHTQGKRKLMRLFDLPARSWPSEEQMDQRMGIKSRHVLQIEGVHWRGKRLGVVTDTYCHLGKNVRDAGDSLALCLGYAEAIKAIHERGLYCGWLAPNDFLCDKAGKAILGSVQERTRESLTKDGEYVRFVAPELVRGGAASEAADTYSLGANFYKILTGRDPFEGSTTDILQLKRKLSLPIPPLALEESIPRSVSSLILQMAAGEPSVRPSIDFVRQVLSEAVSGPISDECKSDAAFVGRVDLLREFAVYLSTRGDTDPVVWILEGPSGIGKTRLSHRLSLTAQFRRVQTLMLRSAPRDSAFGALRRFIGENRRFQSTRASTDIWASLLGSVFEGARTLVFLDDAHWIDHGTAEVLRRLLLGRPDWLAVCNLRNDLAHGEAWKGLCQSLSLHRNTIQKQVLPLSANEVELLLADLRGASPSLQARSQILRQFEGNPFFVIEAIRSKTLCDINESDRGVTERGHPPSSIATILRQRLVPLTHQERRCIQLLTVAQTPIPQAVLQKAMHLPVSTLDGLLNRLIGAGLVSRQGSLTDTLFSCAHDWITWAVRDIGIPQDLERRLARALHQTAEEDDPATRAVSARHYFRGGEVERGISLAISIIPRLTELGLFQEVAELSSEIPCETLLRRLDGNRSFFLAILDAHMRTGKYEHAIKLCKQALELPNLETSFLIILRITLLRALRGSIRTSEAGTEVWKMYLSTLPSDNPQITAELMHSQLLSVLTKTDIEQAALAYDMAVNYRASRDDFSSNLDMAMGTFESQVGSLKAASKSFARAIEGAQLEGNLSQYLGRQQSLAISKLEQKQLTKASSVLNYSLPLATQSPDRGVEAFLLAAKGMAIAASGDHKRAVEFLEKCKAARTGADPGFACEVQCNRNWLLQPHLIIGARVDPKQLKDSGLETSYRLKLAQLWAWLLIGRPERAIAKCPEVKVPFPRGYWRFRILRATALFHVGSLKEADKEGRLAVSEMPDYQHNYRLRVCYLFARIKLAEGSYAGALKLAREALRGSQELWYPPLIAEGHITVSQCICATGKNLTRARAHCLRAHQVAKHCDRPLLHANIWETQASIEAKMGKLASARQCYDRSLLILKSRMLEIPFKYRRKFHEFHIKKIEDSLKHLIGRNQHNILIFNKLPKALAQIRSTHNTDDLLKIIKSIIERDVPNIIIKTREDFSTDEWWPRDVDRRKQPAYIKHAEAGGFPNGPQQTTQAKGQSVLTLQAGPSHKIIFSLEGTCGAVGEVELDYLYYLISFAEGQFLGGGKKLEHSSSSHGVNFSEERRLVGRHPRMQELFQQIRQVARTHCTILILGESGTGKELVARALHEASPRKENPFVALNCGSIPDALIESELFGYRRGSFTGADRDRQGLFEAAHGGTLFLDEISSMPFDLQVRLLRVLQERRVRRIGESRERPVDVRILAASNQDLADLVRQGTFRPDLYFRLKVIELLIPPLRLRKGDIPLLAEYFLDRLNEEYGAGKRFAPEALGLLARHSFPGNVRELEHLVESAFHLSLDDVLDMKNVQLAEAPDQILGSPAQSSRAQRLFEELTHGNKDFWNDVREPFVNRDLCRDDIREIIHLALATCGGNYRQVVRLLGLPDQEYRKLLNFLTHYDCKLDFRPYREQAFA